MAVAALAEHPLDLLVVGGGIAGAAAARDAALRGLKVGLVEAHDFGSGTTGATTRLAHGGLRYVEQLDFPQVREGLRERAWLLRAAPHLVQPLPFLFLLPRGRPFLRAGLRMALWLYDRWGGDVPERDAVTAEEARRREPRLRGAMAGAAAFHDAQILLPERLVLEFVLAAEAAGTRVANHAPVEALAKSAGGWTAHVRDPERDALVEVRARAVLNCAGPWVGKLAGLAGVQRALARTTRGSHIAFPNFLRHALILRARDDRTFFAIPWNEVTLVGTTDIDDAGDPGAAAATKEEVSYLLREAGAFVELPEQPCYTFAGVRALLRVEGVHPSKVPRGHAIVDHADEGLPGFFSVVGGKLTTGRAVGEDAVNAVCRFLAEDRRPPTEALLPGAHGARDMAAFLAHERIAPELARGLGLLGSHAAAALAEGPALCARHATRGLVRRAVQQEHAVHLEDLMLRRSLAGHSPDLGAHCVDALAEAMGELRGWDDAAREAELRAYEQACARRRSGL